MVNEEEAKEFMSLPLPDRFHRFMVKEICSEEAYREWIRDNAYNYLPTLQRVKEDLPVEFFAYFHDLLCDEDYDIYQRKFMTSLGGLFG